ncbi:hypothetical protein [Nocardia huaxiensis]|uniref:Uncharacterized protein n=1 Tax=Nocardia huaxiensis TaxID=2755382 RepID=A0A7D6VIQ1_9NOCA|nr:hypothetical protein [Nocardia huaxiensis]QLY30936.1 hypothetical protein H0264_00550 [Nocardia huaxiensis]UFS94451.1 hypothetical protein LPY97_27350 [Nocardia huaxiensis]
MAAVVTGHSGDMVEWWRPPGRSLDLVVATVIYVLACGAAWFAALLVPEYGALVADTGRDRYLPLAYAVGWFGIIATLMLVPLWTLHAIRLGQRAWPTALLAFPMLAFSWLAGLLVAMVAVS